MMKSWDVCSLVFLQCQPLAWASPYDGEKTIVQCGLLSAEICEQRARTHPCLVSSTTGTDQWTCPATANPLVSTRVFSSPVGVEFEYQSVGPIALNGVPTSGRACFSGTIAFPGKCGSRGDRHRTKICVIVSDSWEPVEPFSKCTNFNIGWMPLIHS